MTTTRLDSGSLGNARKKFDKAPIYSAGEPRPVGYTYAPVGPKPLPKREASRPKRASGKAGWVVIDDGWEGTGLIFSSCILCEQTPVVGETVFLAHRGATVVLMHDTCMIGKLDEVPEESYYKIRQRLEAGGTLFKE